MEWSLKIVGLILFHLDQNLNESKQIFIAFMIKGLLHNMSIAYFKFTFPLKSLH